MLSFKERMTAFFRRNVSTVDKKIDRYLTENLSLLAREYKLATTEDSASLDKKMQDLQKDLEDHESWKIETEVKVKSMRHKVDKLALNHDVKLKGGGK